MLFPHPASSDFIFAANCLHGRERQAIHSRNYAANHTITPPYRIVDDSKAVRNVKDDVPFQNYDFEETRVR